MSLKLPSTSSTDITRPTIAFFSVSSRPAVTFDTVPDPGRYRLVIEEYEFISANYTLMENNAAVQPGRLIFAEIVPLNADLVRE